MGHDRLNNLSFFIKKQAERTEALSSAPSNKQKKKEEEEWGRRERQRQTDRQTDRREGTKKTSNTPGFGGSLRLNLNVCKICSLESMALTVIQLLKIFSLCFFWYHRQDAPTFHQPMEMPYFLSKNSSGAKLGAVAVGWAGESGAGERAEPSTAPVPGRPAAAGSRVPRAARTAAAAMAGTREPFPCLLG